MNGATCSADGIVFDGSDDYVDIDEWEWGGTTSFEVYVKYDSFNFNSRVLDFGSGAASDYIILNNVGTTCTIVSRFGRRVNNGSSETAFGTSNSDSATWTHAVVTIKDTMYKVYKNGVLFGTNADSYEPFCTPATEGSRPELSTSKIWTPAAS